MTEIADRYRELADAFEAKITRVRPEQWTSRSPCDDWDARGVVGHVVEVHGMLLGTADRRLGPAPSVEDDPLGAFRSARADIEKVLDDPALAEREYDGVLGRTSVGRTIDEFLGFDLVVHGWDLARATGQDETIEPAYVERVWTAAKGFDENLRRPGVCGPEVPVPADASPQDRLLGLLGRDPAPSSRS